MKPADIRRLKRACAQAVRLSDTLLDTDERGLTADWRAFGDLKLRHLLTEFADWYERRIDRAERDATREGAQ